MKKIVDDLQRKKVYSDYWERRSNMMYYQYIEFLVRAFASSARNIIDVGSSNAQYIEGFDWIPKRTALDIYNPYQSKDVEGIETDFFSFNTKEKYDFATCLQVLEHISDAKSFALKLFDIADSVLISVPYMWEAGSNSEHVHDPVDLDKLRSWTGKDPSHYVIVQEPIGKQNKSKRLICYYHSKKKVFSLKKALRSADALYTAESNYKLKLLGEVKTLEKQSHNLKDQIKKEINENERLNELLQSNDKRLKMVNNEIKLQKEKNESLSCEVLKLIKEHEIRDHIEEMEMELRKVQTELKDKENINKKKEDNILEAKKNIKRIEQKGSKLWEKEDYYNNKIKDIQHSNIWRYTSFFRKLRKSVRRTNKLP